MIQEEGALLLDIMETHALSPIPRDQHDKASPPQAGPIGGGTMLRQILDPQRLGEGLVRPDLAEMTKDIGLIMSLPGIHGTRERDLMLD